MKAFLSTLVFLGMSSAYAYPTVGDKVEFKMTEVEDAQTKEVTGSVEVVGYNDISKKWTLQKTWMKNGKEKTHQQETTMMFTPEKAQEILTNCESGGGKLEDVTVAAGTFASCLVVKEHGDETKHIWWADVPFGVVKAIETEKDPNEAEETKTYELLSVTHGQ